jgi:leader peptidase (prepilin peptidase)/N-methyltransferase
VTGLPAPAEAAWTALAFILGAAIGSFLATILIRWPQGRSVVAGRSACDKCGRTLEARDLVPILSWSLARGRCRTCGTRIDRRHLAAEAGAAMIGIAAILAHPMPLAAVTAILGWWLFLLAALDLEHEWLPDRLTWPLLAAGLAAGWGGFGPSFDSRLIGAAAGFASLFLIARAYRALRGREGLGGGDAKLFGAIGAWLGWTQLPFVLVGTGLLGIAVLLLKRLQGRAVQATDRLPLGTLMALSAWPIWIVISR